VTRSYGRVRCARGEPGQATVEFALVLPLVVFAALAIIQVGLLVRDHLAVVHAAREAVREASVDPNAAHAVAVARRTLPGADVHVSSRPAVGESIAVEVRYRAVTDVPLVGLLFPDPVLHSRAVMRVEK
jgi:Flp pilus assembly protein TadG